MFCRAPTPRDSSSAGTTRRTARLSAPITFHAEPGAILTGPNDKTADAIDLEGASYIIVEGFTITNPSSTITRAGIRSVTNQNVIIRYQRIDQRLHPVAHKPGDRRRRRRRCPEPAARLRPAGQRAAARRRV
jgi:hypothetical protein